MTRLFGILLRLGRAMGLAAWALVFAVPLAILYIPSDSPLPPEARTAVDNVYRVLPGSAALSAGIALASVLLGILPGLMLARSSRLSAARQAALLAMILAPMLLPNYIIRYAYMLPLSPTTALGAFFAAHPALANFTQSAAAVAAVTLAYWPVAALVLAQGFRNLDASVLEVARLDATRARRVVSVILPLMAGPLATAFGVCFVRSLSEYASFHFSNMTTLGTQLGVLFDLTHSEQAVAQAAWPLVAPAGVMAVVLWLYGGRRSLADATEEGERWRGGEVERGRNGKSRHDHLLLLLSPPLRVSASPCPFCSWQHLWAYRS